MARPASKLYSTFSIFSFAAKITSCRLSAPVWFGHRQSNMYVFHTEIRTSTHLDISQVADITINLYNYKEFRG